MGKRPTYLKLVTNSTSEAAALADQISKATNFTLDKMRTSEGQTVAFLIMGEGDKEVGDST